MKLTVLGSGSIMSDGSRASAGYLLDSGKNKIVIDLGIGCFKNLQKVANPLDISAVFLSHYGHPDHFSDLIAFLMHRKISVKNGAQSNQLNLFGPKGFSDFYKKLVEAIPFFESLPFPVKTAELENGSFKLFGFEIKTKPVKHLDVASIGFRIENNEKFLAYSGDSEYCDALIDLGMGTDLLILECSATEEKKTEGHLSPGDCARLGKQANAKSLLLSHFYPATEALDLKKIVSKDYSGKILLAADLMKVEV